MKSYAAIALVACITFVAMAATPSHAQVLIKANVPFEFCAGQAVHPAGEYAITRGPSFSALVLSAGRRGIEIMLPKTTEWRNSEATKLVFHRYGDEYFLAEIWSELDGSMRQLNVTPRERQLAKAGMSPEVAVVYGLMPAANGN
jgi:hypothetical protein